MGVTSSGQDLKIANREKGNNHQDHKSASLHSSHLDCVYMVATVGSLIIRRTCTTSSHPYILGGITLILVEIWKGWSFDENVGRQ